MELWIRSQDKKRLFKIDKLGIEESKEFLVVLYTDKYEWYRLGNYKTEERALEVLNEIQNIIKPKPILQAKPILNKENMDRIQDDYGMTVLPSCVDVIEPISTSFVYEMPKE